MNKDATEQATPWRHDPLPGHRPDVAAYDRSFWYVLYPCFLGTLNDSVRCLVIHPSCDVSIVAWSASPTSHAFFSVAVLHGNSDVMTIA